MKKNQWSQEDKPYKNGKQHGLWEAYHGNGDIWYKGYWKNGNQDGYWELFHGKRRQLKEFYV